MGVVSGGRPWPGLAAAMLLLSMALFVASIASSRWIENQATGRQMSLGPYEACARDYKANLDECRRVDDSCNIGFNAPIGMTSLSDCDYARTTRAFMVLGLIFAGLSFLFSWLAYHAISHDIMYRVPAILCALISFTLGLIGWAVWVSMTQRDYSGDWNYGWATGVALGAWLLPLAAAVANMMPSPARDLKEGEVIARDTARGRRGSWFDIFTRDFWTRSGDWGGHEPGLAGTTTAGGRSRYEAPAGVGYRESKEEPRGYGYGESRETRETREAREARERPGFFEKMMGRDDPAERREREWRQERGGFGTHGTERAGYERGYEPERGGLYKTESAPSSSTYTAGSGYRAAADPQSLGSTTTTTAGSGLVSREPSTVEEPITQA